MGKIVPGIGRKVIKRKVYSLALPMRSLLKCLMKAQRNTRSVQSHLCIKMKHQLSFCARIISCNFFRGMCCMLLGILREIWFRVYSSQQKKKYFRLNLYPIIMRINMFLVAYACSQEPQKMYLLGYLHSRVQNRNS